jgi:ankyrin repeat protein
MNNTRRVVPIIGEVLNAIQERDLERLRTLLNTNQGDDCISDHSIAFALCKAADHWDSVEACRLLNDRLSVNYKKRWHQSSKCKNDSPLHAAAFSGRLETVRFLLPMFDVNLMNESNRTPLWYAAASVITPQNNYSNSLTICQLLLDNGAHVNHIQGEKALFGILYHPVWEGHTELVRLLLEHGADPNVGRRRPGHSTIVTTTINLDQGDWYCTDVAILNGHAEIVSMLLRHGALMGGNREYPSLPYIVTSLNCLLRGSGRRTRKIKVTICEILVNHAMINRDTAAFLQSTLENEIENTTAGGSTEGCEILLEAGLVPSRCALFIAIQAGNEAACRLLTQHGIDPFLEKDNDHENDRGNRDNHAHEGKRGHAPSPFHAAARLTDMAILRYFMQLWNERFAASGGGRDTNGNSPLHALCRDKHVSIQAIQLLVQEFQANVAEQYLPSAVHDGKPLHFPFHSAVMADASLNVLYYLLNHFPDAALTTTTKATTSTRTTNTERRRPGCCGASHCIIL